MTCGTSRAGKCLRTSPCMRVHNRTTNHTNSQWQPMLFFIRVIRGLRLITGAVVVESVLTVLKSYSCSSGGCRTASRATIPIEVACGIARPLFSSGSTDRAIPASDPTSYSQALTPIIASWSRLLGFASRASGVRLE